MENNTNEQPPLIVSIIGTILLIAFLIVCFNTIRENHFKPKKEYGAKDWVNTKWKDTYGYELEISESSCVIKKDNKKLENICKFTIDSNDSGVGKLEICNSYGLNCSSREISTTDYESVPDDFSLYSHRWYRQDDK